MSSISDTSSGVTAYIGKVLPMIAENSRSLVVVAGLLAITLVGALTVPNLPTRLGTTLAAGAGFLLLIVIVLLYLLAREAARPVVGQDPAQARQALTAINGHWWQLVENDTAPGLSLLHIQLSTLPGRHHMAGEKWQPSGKPMAYWSSRAVAIQGLEPFKLFYIWEGGYYEHRRDAGTGQVSTGQVSGIGTFLFPNASTIRGTGWFTTGNVDELDFDEHSSVILRRASAADMQTMHGEDESKQEALVQGLYSAWLAELSPR